MENCQTGPSPSGPESLKLLINEGLASNEHINSPQAAHPLFINESARLLSVAAAATDALFRSIFFAFLALPDDEEMLAGNASNRYPNAAAKPVPSTPTASATDPSSAGACGADVDTVASFDEDGGRRLDVAVDSLSPPEISDWDP
jgi:hypothetical protein